MEFNNKWKEYILYDLANWKNGLAFKDIYFSNKGKPVIKIAELKNGITEQTKFTEGDYGEEVYLRKNDLIFSWSGNPKTFIDAFLYDLPEGYLNQHSFKITEKKEIINKYFLYYILKYLNPLFQSIATDKQTTGLGHVTVADLKKIKVRVPNLQEQNKFLDIIKNIDDKIYINNQINDNLQKLCNHYYLYLINDKNKEVSLAELMEYQGGSQPPASEFQYISSNENVRFVQIRDFDTDSHICYIPNSNKNKICQEDDILIARYGASLGRICYGLYGAYNVALAKVLPKDDKYKELIRIILESKEFYEYINNVGQRSAQAGFNAGDIQAYKVKVPDNDNDIINYNHLAKECLNKRLLNNKENKRLEELRDTLLPKLMNGEINLDKIEI